nr:MAG TPA: hypothetical protein [Caudoviricetes sp.]
MKIKKRTENGRFTKEAAEIVIAMLKEGVIQGTLCLGNEGVIIPDFYQDNNDEERPYKIGGRWYTPTLTYPLFEYSELDIVDFTDKSDREEFKRRWKERYPKKMKSESKSELTYPLFAKSKKNGIIILFTSEYTGICVVGGKGTGIGVTQYATYSECWLNATDTEHWQHLSFAEVEAEIFNK